MRPRECATWARKLGAGLFGLPLGGLGALGEPLGLARRPAPSRASRTGLSGYRCERGVGKLVAQLNGVDYIDGYDELRNAA
ncbi:hypothetical protein ACFY41_24570 [Streptomyces syringium]|uniref:hypothetical protein n=1 Tax=Streptomyces syringium TaxID=76729 RepID=UPI0036A56A84